VLVNKMEHMKWAQNKFDDIKNFFESVVEDLGFQKDNVQFIPASGLNC
jgi:translation elongation factor EF-1alpha